MGFVLQQNLFAALNVSFLSKLVNVYFFFVENFAYKIKDNVWIHLECSQYVIYASVFFTKQVIFVEEKKYLTCFALCKQYVKMKIFCIHWTNTTNVDYLIFGADMANNSTPFQSSAVRPIDPASAQAQQAR